MILLHDVMGFCISLHWFCLIYLCFCLRLSSNREQPPGSFVRADSAERAHLCCKTRRLCSGACNVFSRKQLMQSEESISVLIHVDTVSFFYINFLTFRFGNLQVKRVFNSP